MRQPSSTPLATSKLSAGTMKEKSEEGSSMSETSCFEGPNQLRRNINSLSIIGRTLYADRGDPTGHLPTEGRQWQRSHQHLEHRTVTSFLPLKIRSYRFLSFNFCSYKHRSPNTFGPGHSVAPRGCDTTSLFYYHIVNTFSPERKGSPFL